MSEHGKKKIAPIIITVFMLIYYSIYFGVIVYLIPAGFKLVVGVILFIIGVAMIYVCAQRLKEIDGGEEDDLSKY